MQIQQVKTRSPMEFLDIENILNETDKVLKDEDQYLIHDHFGFWIEGVFLVRF